VCNQTLHGKRLEMCAEKRLNSVRVCSRGTFAEVYAVERRCCQAAGCGVARQYIDTNESPACSRRSRYKNGSREGREG